MHDRIRLALSAAGIAAVTLLASGHPIAFMHPGAPAKAALAGAAQAPGVAAVSAQLPDVSPAPEVRQPEIRLPPIRRAPGADLNKA
jgi:hypothetical protein